MKIIALQLTFFFMALSLKAQNNVLNNFGAQFGLSFNVGTHVNRLGLSSKVYYHFEHLQINFQSAFYYNFSSLGSEKKGLEAQFQLGLTGIWGRVDSFRFRDPFLNSFGNQTLRPNSVSYAYLLYLDGFGTTQLSGLFALEIHNFKFVFENDFLAFQSLDRYRTGAIAMQYRWNNWQFGIKQLSFTGDPYAKNCPWIEDGVFPSRSGFIDMTAAPLGNKSLGIFAIQIERRLTELSNVFPVSILKPQIGIEIGIDSEHIRNIFQNKLVHDSKILPLNWGKVKNPHIPMLCSDGCPYTYHPGQEIRKNKFYTQILMNNLGFY
jgi:hypothetical protein